MLPEGTGGLDGQLNFNAFQGYTLTGRECIEPTCGEREKIMPDGSCKKCDSFSVVSSDGRQCEMPECEFNERVELDGSCVKCEPYSKVSDDRLTCEDP